MEDWDLQAVVRGCSNGDESADMMSAQKSPTLAPPLRVAEGDHSFSFLSNMEPVRGDFNDLEDLYKPFCPGLRQVSGSTKTIWDSVGSGLVTKQECEVPVFQKQLVMAGNMSDSSDSSSFHAVSWKRSRKNEQKRVVHQMTADGLSSDMWAWRKYGQKPIKGSPYPRSYYRCSSQKGCLARKQVERSSTNPMIFIVTYTAEHSHPQPPRRNALAGSTRVKSLSSDSKKVTITLPTLLKHSEGSIERSSMAAMDDLSAQPNATKDDQIVTSPVESIVTMFPPHKTFQDEEMYPSFDDFHDLLLY